MLAKLFYQEKGLFLQSFHPAAVLIYLAVLLLLSLLYDNPLYLAALLLLLALLIKAVDGLAAWEGFLKAGLILMLLVMLINPLLIRAGATIIWHGPAVPLLGKLDVSMEAMYFGVAAGLRLLVVISIFCLYNLMVNPDRVLSLFSKIAGKSVLMIILATRMFPAMVRDLHRIREVLQLRGVDFEEGSCWERIKKYSYIYDVMLFSSLENSLEVAESMQSRAYGSGKRSAYKGYLLRPRDLILLGGSMLALAFALWGLHYGCGQYRFYPQSDYLIRDKATAVTLFVVFFYLSVPLIMGEGWKRCRFLRSKI